MDMRRTSPAMIQKTITNDWKTKQCEEAEGHIVGGIGANRSVVERLVQVWEKAKVVKVGIQWLAGVLPTPQWMSTKGWSIEARCMICGEEKDLAHEITGCLPRGQTPGRNGMRSSIRKTEEKIRSMCRTKDCDRSEDIDWEGGIEAWEDGVKVEWKDFFFEIGEKI